MARNKEKDKKNNPPSPPFSKGGRGGLSEKNIIEKLDVFFNPKSIAIVGASGDENKPSGVILKNLPAFGYKGKLYPVNPKYETLSGYKCYPSVLNIPDKIDLSIIIIPAPYVPKVLSEHAEKGIKSVVISSSGFGETGEDGKRLEDEIKDISKRAGIRILGPNCLGVIDNHSRLSTFFLPLEKIAKARPGNLSFLSQSGSFVGFFWDIAPIEDIGIAKIVNYGNRADVGEIELLRYLAEDEKTKVIALYMESVQEGRGFIESARFCANKKPVVAIKAGKFEKGIAAVKSHTGALAGRYEIYRAAFKKAGVIEVFNFLEIYDYSKGLAMQPFAKGNKLLIVTCAGGIGVVMADLAPREGIELPQFPEDLKDRLKKKLPRFYSISNPLDLTGSVTDKDYEMVLEECLINDPFFDAVIVVTHLAVPGLTKGVFDIIAEKAKRSGRPVVVCTTAGEETIAVKRDVEEKGIPVYFTPERAVRVIGALVKRGKILQSTGAIGAGSPRPYNGLIERAKAIIDDAVPNKDRPFTEDEAKALLKAIGIPVPEHFVAQNKEDAFHAANTIGWPVAMKIVSPDILHKSDVGGVRLNIQNREELYNAYDAMMKDIEKKAEEAMIKGILIEGMVKKGTEIIIGGIRDKQFGPCVMFGLGGIFVEVLKDVSFGIAPVNMDEAMEMIREIKSYPILTGFRGTPPADVAAIARTIVIISEVLADVGEISEMDLNPVIVYPQGLVVADAKILPATASPPSH